MSNQPSAIKELIEIKEIDSDFFTFFFLGGFTQAHLCCTLPRFLSPRLFKSSNIQYLNTSVTFVLFFESVRGGVHEVGTGRRLPGTLNFRSSSKQNPIIRIPKNPE